MGLKVSPVVIADWVLLDVTSPYRSLVSVVFFDFDEGNFINSIEKLGEMFGG